MALDTVGEIVTTEVLLPDDPWLAEKAERIRLRGQRITSDIIAIGQDLIDVRERLPHGTWLPWLSRNFGWTRKTADNFVAVAEMFAQRVVTVTTLPIDASALYLLAAPKVSEPVRDVAIERAEAGEHITKAEVERMLADVEEAATKRAAQAIRDAEAQQRDAAEFAQHRIEQLEERLARDSNTIEQRNQIIAELERARDEARETAVSDHINHADPLDILADMLGTNRGLTENQVRGLAIALGRPLVFKGRTLPPATVEDEETARERIRVGGSVLSALLALSALPDPATVREHMTDAQRGEADRLAKQARRWVDAFSKAAKEPQS